jgi:hypothetical protein
MSSAKDILTSRPLLHADAVSAGAAGAAVALSARTARGLRNWLGANNYDSGDAIPVAVLETAIQQAEARSASRMVSAPIPILNGPRSYQDQRSFLSGAFAVASIVHSVVVCALFNHHSKSSYPPISRAHGIYSIVIGVIVSVLAVAGFVASLMNYTPLSRKCLTGTIAAAIVANMSIVVALFAVQESRGRSYQGQGRTLTIYDLVISVLLFLAGGLLASYRLGLMKGRGAEGRIVLV